MEPHKPDRKLHLPFRDLLHRRSPSREKRSSQALNSPLAEQWIRSSAQAAELFASPRAAVKDALEVQQPVSAASTASSLARAPKDELNTDPTISQPPGPTIALAVASAARQNIDPVAPVPMLDTNPSSSLPLTAPRAPVPTPLIDSSTLWQSAYDKVQAENPILMENYGIILKADTGLPQNIDLREQLADIVSAQRRKTENRQWTYQWL